MKRTVEEIYINQYNPEWLNAWDANIDLQLCLDYFAVLTYITDYYTKDDTGTMKFLTEVARTCTYSNIKDKMKALSQAFLKNRQIGESEAFYRIIPNLHLTDSNIKCFFYQLVFQKIDPDF